MANLFHDRYCWNFRREMGNSVSVWESLLMWLHCKPPSITKMGKEEWIEIHRQFTTQDGFLRISAWFVTSFNVPKKCTIWREFVSYFELFTLSEKLNTTKDGQKKMKKIYPTLWSALCLPRDSYIPTTSNSPLLVTDNFKYTFGKIRFGCFGPNITVFSED